MNLATNPYFVGPPVDKAESFIGRADILRQLTAKVRGPTRVVRISGPRRIGKSSLLIHFARNICSPSNAEIEAIGVYRDLQRVEFGVAESDSSEARAAVLAGELLDDLTDGSWRRSCPNLNAGQATLRHTLPAHIARIQTDFGRRLVFALDEVDYLIEEHGEGVLAELVRILSQQVVSPPLLLLGWGRTLGEVREHTPAAHRILKDSVPIEVPLFTQEDEHCLEGLVAYPFDAEAGVRIGELSGYHPLLMAALHDQFYRKRCQPGTAMTDRVTVAEVNAAAARAVREVSDQLHWIWLQLSVNQCRITKAVADLAGANPLDAPHDKFVTWSEVRTELRRGGREVDEVTVNESQRGLVENSVLRCRNDKLQIWSPLIGHWLQGRDYEELEAGRFSQHVRRARSRLREGNVTVALQEFESARQYDRLHPRDSGDYLGLLLRAGRNGEAIAFATAEARDEAVSQYAEPFCRLLRSSLDEGMFPEDLYRLLRRAAPAELERSELGDRIATLLVGKWARRLGQGDSRRYAPEFEVLEREQIAGWREVAAPSYADVVANLAGSRLLCDSLEGLLAAFLIILRDEPRWVPQSIRDALRQRKSLALSDDAIQDVIDTLRCVGTFSGSDEVPSWWCNTVAAIDNFWRFTAPDGIVPADLLQPILAKAPQAAFSSLKKSLLTGIVPRFAVYLSAGDFAAFHLLATLQPSPDEINAVIGHMRRFITSLVQPDDDDKLIQYFTSVIIFLGRLPVLVGDCFELFLDDLVTLAAQTIDRMRATKEADESPERLLVAAIDALPAWRSFLGTSGFATSRTEPLLKQLELSPGAERRARGLSTSLDLGKPPELGADVVLEPGAVRSGPGVDSSTVRIYRGKYRDQLALIKVFHLPERKANARLYDLLYDMWQREQRVLADLSSRRQGKGITKFLDSFVRDEQMLVIVSEGASRLSLRDLIRRESTPLLMRLKPEIFWNLVHDIVDAVATLHHFSYLHRNLRPENIYVTETTSDTGVVKRFHPKLANFEWSIYLHAIARHSGGTRGFFDYYTAPEVVTSHLAGRKPNAIQGESFRSEVYSLGLVLFELFVRPLDDAELRLFGGIHGYRADEHRKWLERLADEVRGMEDPLSRTMLLEMLRFDARHREANLVKAAEDARRMAVEAMSLQGVWSEGVTPFVATTIHSVRNEHSILNFLSWQTDVSAIRNGEISLQDFLLRELRGAKLYLNSRAPDVPIYIEGSQSVSFTASPLDVSGRRFLSIPYIMVVKAGDRRVGEEIARIPRNANLHVVDTKDARRTMTGSGLLQVVQYGEFWQRLFELAEHSDAVLDPEDRRFLDALSLTAQAESQLWQKHVAHYEVCEEHKTNETWLVTVRDATHASLKNRSNLFRVVLQFLERDQPAFELGDHNSPIGSFDDSRVWNVEEVKYDTGEVILSRPKRETREFPRSSGFLRPVGLRGNQRIYERRQDLLRRLDDDAYLLSSLRCNRHVERIDSPDGSTAIKDLDEDKRRVVENILRTPPLFVVQGPPGTGKTTLAAEVIQRTIGANRSARILVTSQSHDPLNNLLSRVTKDFKEAPDEGFAVRLLHQKRLHEMKWAGAEGKCAKEHHPSEVASRLLKRTKARLARDDNDVAPRRNMEVARQFREFLNRAEADGIEVELTARVQRSASLVFVTANDQQIEALARENKPFDLVIYEEAAKAYPLEVIAPMTLARRWLLIGDHDQLPPFNADEFKTSFMELLTASDRRPNVPAYRRRDWAEINLDEATARTAESISLLFHSLFQRGSSPQSGNRPRWADRLTKQWRMHSAISSVLRDAGYYSFLQDASPDLDEAKQLHVTSPSEFQGKHIIWVDTPRAYSLTDPWREKVASGGGYFNRYEVLLLRELLHNLDFDVGRRPPPSLMVLSPYRAQVFALRRELRYDEQWDNQREAKLRKHVRPQMLRRIQRLARMHPVENTLSVDSAQGRQADIVLVSLVRNNDAVAREKAFGFLENRERLGVMFSRAEKLLIVIGCAEQFKSHREFHLTKAIESIEACGGLIRASKLEFHGKIVSQIEKWMNRTVRD